MHSTFSGANDSFVSAKVRPPIIEKTLERDIRGDVSRYYENFRGKNKGKEKNIYISRNQSEIFSRNSIIPILGVALKVNERTN